MHFIVEIDNVQSTFLLCSKCLKIYLTVHYTNINESQIKIKKYFNHTTYLPVLRIRELLCKIRDAYNWCMWCKQVPLFQVADYKLCENIVGTTIHRCPTHYPIDEQSDDFIYCTNCYGTGNLTRFSFSREIDISTFLEN